MMKLSREEYMYKVGTSQVEQNNLKELTFETLFNELLDREKQRKCKKIGGNL